MWEMTRLPLSDIDPRGKMKVTVNFSGTKIVVPVRRRRHHRARADRPGRHQVQAGHREVQARSALGLRALPQVRII